MASDLADVARSARLEVPTRGYVRHETAAAVMNEILTQRGPVTISGFAFAVGDTGVSDVRNNIAARFLDRHDDDVLLMLDDDVVPPTGFSTIACLVGGDVGMAALPYPVAYKGKRVASSIFAVADGVYSPRDVRGGKGVVDCDAAGTGCVAISREALRAIPRPFDSPTDDRGRTILGEDMAFCRSLRLAGFRVVADCSRWCGHVFPAEAGGLAGWWR